MKKPLLEDRQILTVSELNSEARSLLESRFTQVWVEGEVSNFVRPSSGHWYFTLKDQKAQVRCAMFANRNRVLRFQMREGLRVILRGKASLYEGRGDYQLIAENLMPAGEGLLQQRFEELKRKLAGEGLFDEANKKAVPTLPRHIGVITSPTGAAVRDILSVLGRRFPAIPVTVIPTAVQGQDAAAQIVSALELAQDAEAFDLLIVGRGGGSIEDLWPFNEEKVARAIFDCIIPVVSAVGHEIDFTIADFVADVRAPTPSAAAELASPDREAWMKKFSTLALRMADTSERQIQHTARQLSQLNKRLKHPGQRLREQSQRLDELEIRLQTGLKNRIALKSSAFRTVESDLQQHNPIHRVAAMKLEASAYGQRLTAAAQLKTINLGNRFHRLADALDKHSPLQTLGRGYAILQNEQGHLVQQTAQTQVGAPIKARLQDGSLNCVVESISDETL